MHLMSPLLLHVTLSLFLCLPLSCSVLMHARSCIAANLCAILADSSLPFALTSNM